MGRARRISCLVVLAAIAQIGAAAAETKICPIAIELFGAVSGVNSESFTKMKALLESPKYQRLKIETYRWGIEGEKTWCISNAENSHELFNELQAINATAQTTRQSKPAVFGDFDLQRTPGGGATFAYRGLTPPQP